MSVKPALFLKLQVPFFTPRYEKRKWKYYYIFSVVGNPFNLKRIYIVTPVIVATKTFIAPH